MAKKSVLLSRPHAPITPLQFLLALDQVTRDARGDDDPEVTSDFDEDAVTQPYIEPRGRSSSR